MMFWIGWSSSVSNRRSRLVTIPTTRQPGATTGSPEMRCCWVSFSTSRTVMSSEIVIGSLTMPLSKRLTFVTSAACARGDMFLWMMPIPPSWAMAIASRASVTVSMAEDTTGMLRPMLRVSRVLRLTSRGRTVEWAGTRRTSSKVKAFSTTRMSYPFRTKPALYAGGCKPPTNPCVSRLTLQRKTRKLPRPPASRNVRKTMSLKYCAAVLLLIAPGFAGAQINKCLDAGGKVVAYGSECPAGTRPEATNIKNQPSAAPAPSQKSAADLDAEFRKRRVQQQESAAEAQKKSADAADRKRACE